MNLPSTKYPWIYPVKRLVVSRKVGRWCRLPYDGHAKGCPKWSCDKMCPPIAPAVGEYFDMGRPLYLVHSEFNLANHILRMEKKHPDWTLKQCRCVLYWQNTSRKQLKERAAVAASLLGTDRMAMVPEAMGINVYATARISGLKLERIRHMAICRHVAMLGYDRHGQMAMFKERRCTENNPTELKLT
jgi:hypothetical protein